MKHVHEIFSDEEFETLQKAKEKSGKKWHDFIMTLVEAKKN